MKGFGQNVKGLRQNIKGFSQRIKGFCQNYKYFDKYNGILWTCFISFLIF